MSDEEIKLPTDTEAILLEFLADKAIREEKEGNSSDFLFEENWVRMLFKGNTVCTIKCVTITSVLLKN